MSHLKVLFFIAPGEDRLYFFFSC